MCSLNKQVNLYPESKNLTPSLVFMTENHKPMKTIPRQIIKIQHEALFK